MDTDGLWLAVLLWESLVHGCDAWGPECFGAEVSWHDDVLVDWLLDCDRGGGEMYLLHLLIL